MTIRAEGPDGHVFEFPDGTGEAVISRVIREHYAESSNARPTPTPRRAPRNIAELVGGAPALPARGQGASPLQEATGALANINAGIPFANDFMNLLGGLMETGRTAADVRQPITVEGLVDAYQRGAGHQQETERALRDDFSARRPLAADFARGTGAALPIALSMGAATPEVAAASAPRSFIGNTARAAATGGAYGGVYGFGTSEGDLNERLQSANQGAGVGALLGAATPAAISVTSPALRVLGGLFERLPTAEPNAVGAMGGNLRRPPARPRTTSPLTPATQRRLPQLADRARMSAEDVERAIGEAQRNPQGQTLVDVFGDAGVRHLAPIVQAPGRTGALAAETAGQRFQAAPERIISALRRGLNVSETRGAALRRLRGEYDRASAELYTPVLRQTLSAEQRGNLDAALRPFESDPVFRDARLRAERIFNRDRSTGLVRGSLEDNFARFSHYLKMGLDDAVAAAPIGSRGLQATEMRGVYEMRSQILRALDENIPGYRDARLRWGGLREAEEALDEGAQFLRMDAEEVQQRVAEMTPFQLEHARIGLAHELQQRIGLAGNTVGNANVANIQALRSPEMQRRLTAAFETPEQAADFLDNTVRTQNTLMRNASGWTGGSRTQGNQAYEADGALAAVTDVAGSAVTHGPGHAANVAARKFGNAILNGAVERSNNEFGQDLLRRIDEPTARRFTDEVLRLLREREASRYVARKTSRVVAAGGGATAGSRRN